MLPASIGYLFILEYFLLTCLLGGCCGMAMSLGFRQRWTLADSIKDAAAAGAGFVLALLAIGEIGWQHRKFNDPINLWLIQHINRWSFVAIGLLFAVIFHVVRSTLAFNSASRHRA
jgi:hypothetical protein